jgi:hypothetical protein
MKEVRRPSAAPHHIPLRFERPQIVCVGSVEELEKLSGVTGITDIHRDKIDHITIPSKRGKGRLRRVEEVFDCWFESGRSVKSLPGPCSTCSHMSIACPGHKFTILSRIKSASRRHSLLILSRKAWTKLVDGSTLC